MRYVPLLVCLLALCAHAADWPQWRGLNRDGVSPEKGLLKTWPKAGPKLLWQTDKAGGGISGMAVVGGIVYTMGTRGDKPIWDDEKKKHYGPTSVSIAVACSIIHVRSGPWMKRFTFSLSEASRKERGSWGSMGPRMVSIHRRWQVQTTRFLRFASIRRGPGRRHFA